MKEAQWKMKNPRNFAFCIQAAFFSSLLTPGESRQRHQPSTVNGERLRMDRRR
jgi:hypothetical protein